MTNGKGNGIMSPNALPLQASVRQNFLTIPKAVLCLIYGIVPICLAMMFFDTFFFNGILRRTFPSMPESFFIIAVLFTDPHIMGSFFSFYDKEYFAHYKTKLLLGIFFFTFLIYVPPYYFGSKGWIFVGAIYLIWAMEHTVGQQSGLTRMMTHAQAKSFSVWWWSSFSISLVLSFSIYVHAILHSDIFARYATIIPLVLMLPFGASALSIHRQCSDPWGTRYLWLNFLLVISSYIAYVTGYLFFALFMSRFVHDLTAFMFYTAHDRNRNTENVRNILYRPFQHFGISATVVCPILAILIAFPSTYILHLGVPTIYHIPPKYVTSITDFLSHFGMIVGFMHYYTDSFVWKKGSLHRRYISIA